MVRKAVKKPIYVEAKLGSVSSGTMREEDLIPDFTDLLEDLARQSKDQDDLKFVRAVRKRMQRRGYFASEQAGYDLNEGLFDRLDKYAPPGAYFGANEGDGSDYGFWGESSDDEYGGGKRRSPASVKTPVKRPRFIKLRYSLFDDEGSEATSSIDGRSTDHIIKMVRDEAQEWADDQGAPVSYMITDYDGNEVDEDTMKPAVAGRAPSSRPQRATVMRRKSTSTQVKRIRRLSRGL